MRPRFSSEIHETPPHLFDVSRHAGISRAGGVILSGVRLCYGCQLFDPSVIVWPGQDGPIGVNVIHREEEGDCFHFCPK